MATNSDGAKDFAPVTCCEMRRYFPLMLMKSPENLPQPANLLDFIILTGAGPTIYTKFCPFCGKEIDPGQTRFRTTIKDGQPDSTDDSPD